MTNTLAVAVIIPAYNAAPYLTQAIDSLLSQTRPPEEICVVDDGSSDDTAAIARTYGDKITLLSHSSAKGSSAARNAGVQATTSPYIAFLDADDIASPERLAIQAEQLEHHSDAVLTFCSMAYINEQGDTTGDIIKANDYGSEGFAGHMLVRNRIGSTSAVMLRRDAFTNAGGFDETLTHNEEYALWLHMAFLGTVIATPETLIQYRLHDSNISHDRKTQQQNETRVLQKIDWLTIIEAVRIAYPDEPEYTLALARIRIRRQEAQAARQLLEDLEERGMQDARVEFYLGNLNYGAKEFSRARVHYAKCLETAPDMAEALNNLAVIEAEQKNLAIARKFFQQAVSLITHYADATHNLQVLENNNLSKPLRITETLLRQTLKPETLSV